jgi:enoyl-CoA hydratase
MEYKGAEYGNINIENRNGTAILTINRPEVRNALDRQTWEELRSAFFAFKNDLDIQAIVITGAGGKAFASGADIRSFTERKVTDMMNSDTNDILHFLSNLPKPVIAAIDGYSLGGGNELALACDIRVATRRSKFGQPEVKLGIIASSGGTQRLQRLVGSGRAKQLLFTGDIITAEEAERIGLVEILVDDGEALNAALALADKIKANGPLAVELTKMAVNIGSDVDLRSGLYLERYFQALAFATRDREEGVRAFLEKRRPAFKGE